MPNELEPIILKAKDGHTFANFISLTTNESDILTVIEVFADIPELAKEFNHCLCQIGSMEKYPYYRILLPRKGTWAQLERRQKAILSTPTIILGQDENILKADVKAFAPTHKGDFELRLIRLEAMLGENMLLHAEERLMMSTDLTALQIEIRNFTNQRLSEHNPVGPAVGISVDVINKML